MPDDAYCTVDDVGDVLQDDFAGANPATDEVQAAIRAQVADIRRRTERHWYDSSKTDSSIVANSAVSVTGEPHDIAAGPHTTPGDIFQHEEVQRRYPNRAAGRYATVDLDRRHAGTVTKLLVRSSGGGYLDWVAASDKVEGRGEDYYVEVDPHTGQSTLHLRREGIGAIVDYSDAVIVSYDYGEADIPDAIRRANALLAAEQLVIDDDMQAGIPGDGQLVALESKADQYHSRAERLLDSYTQDTPIA